MPIGPVRNKADKARVVRQEMHKFGQGKLHSGSKHGPVVTNPKQAIAISMSESKQGRNMFGNIPTNVKAPRKPQQSDQSKVMKAEGQHKKQAAASRKTYDRSGHFPGNPGFNREGKPPYRQYNAGAQAKQPQGHSIGVNHTTHRPGESYAAEQREHWGNKAEGKTMKDSGKEVACVGTGKRGSSMIGEAGGGHAKQPQGKSIGINYNGGAEHHQDSGMGGTAHSFKPPAANMAHGYGHTVSNRSSGSLRLSGHSGAHQVGKR